MKKIISALTLGAMVAGAAFADVGLASTTDSVQHSFLIQTSQKATESKKLLLSSIQTLILETEQITLLLTSVGTSLLSRL